MVPTICRECCKRLATVAVENRCPHCGSPRLVAHPELYGLTLAHIDCDAFYANVEKRDDPTLADCPVIVGGRHRGVVTACCYVARLYGVHSAMPMFKAIKACPEAVVIKPDMKKYQRVGRIVRDMMLSVTPLVEPLSIDEAFLDLSGTERLHKSPAAVTLARLARRIEREIGLTVSVGLSYNKFLAKVASDLDKPRGFSVIGRSEAIGFLDDKPVSLIWGVGKSLRAKLNRDGLRYIGQLRSISEKTLTDRYGSIGRRLHAFAHGRDHRKVNPDGTTKTISAETTFDHDIVDLTELRRILWRLSEQVSGRLKAAGLSAGGITLKLKTQDFRIRTRSRRLPRPTEVAELMFRAAEPLLAAECDGTKFRLIGIGANDLRRAATTEDTQVDLLAQESDWRVRQVENIIDDVRSRLGPNVIGKGRSLKPTAK